MNFQSLFSLTLAALAACGFTESSETIHNNSDNKTEVVLPSSQQTAAINKTAAIELEMTEISEEDAVETSVNTRPALNREEVRRKVVGDERSLNPDISTPVKEISSMDQDLSAEPLPNEPLEVENYAQHPTLALDLVAPPSHAAFSALLKEYVNASGGVDYKGLKTKHGALKDYLKLLADNPPADSWSRDEKLAYWINAYNAATLDLIVTNYPLSKITDLDGGKTWDVKRVKLGDKTYSLNEIENEIIRPQFKEPRIHFAVNCAAASCPPLRNEAFVASKLSSQLEQQTKQFINDPRYTSVVGSELRLSRIFDWYGKDFGDVLAFVKKYRTVPSGASVMFTEYNWALNKQ